MIHEQNSFEKFENRATIQYWQELNEKLPGGGQKKTTKNYSSQQENNIPS